MATPLSEPSPAPPPIDEARVPRSRPNLRWTPPEEDTLAVRRSRLRVDRPSTAADTGGRIPEPARRGGGAASEEARGTRRALLPLMAVGAAVTVAALAGYGARRWRSMRVPFVEERVELRPGAAHEVQVEAARGATIEGHLALEAELDSRVDFMISDERRRLLLSIAALSATASRPFHLRTELGGQYTLAVAAHRAVPRPGVYRETRAVVILRYRVLPPQ